MPVARTNSHRETNSQCLNLCCRNVSFCHRLVKVFLSVVVAFFIFTIGLGFGFKMGYFGTNTNRYYKNAAGVKMMKGNLARPALTTVTRLYGTVSTIEGNKITVTNNAAGETIVISQLSTVIVSTESEMGLAALKPGINVVASGVLNKENQLEAQLIRVL